MSQNLYWRPEVKPVGRPLPDTLKYVLRSRYSLGTEGRVFNAGDVNYLEGLRDAKVEGADTLLELIEKHEEVRVFIE